MKEVLAVIRPNRIQATKEALAHLGFASFTAQKVLGRGKQRGLTDELGFAVDTDSIGPPPVEARWIPKRLISLVVDDAEVPAVVHAIMKVNCTGAFGDGRIFICPVDDVLRVRTGETGPQALT